jgi:hypothetical protein
LRAHGKDGKEWIVALGSQEFVSFANKVKIVTDIYDLNCHDSTAISAEPDYVDLSDAQNFYEHCGGAIVGLAHNHNVDANFVVPSLTDWKTQMEWEKLYKGNFIGIVFTRNGVFRIYHTDACRLRPTIFGKGVRKLREGLYALEFEKRRCDERASR